MSGRCGIRHIVVEADARREPLTRDILTKMQGVPVRMEHGTPHGSGPGGTDPDKSTLHLLDFKGEFLKPCPGTKEYICCGYRILNVGTNCPMDCSYCILQSYFNKPHIRVFANLDRELESVLGFIDDHPERLFRIGTGEFTDSLACDPVTGWAGLLIPRFTVRKNAVLELKTKSVNVDGVLSTPFRDRIIVSWSLNSPHVTDREEHGAPSLKARLEAARRCQSEGFVVGFHFDPLIPHALWRQGYESTVELMDKYLNPKGIIWISLGSFRFMPPLKPLIRKRHPSTCVLDGEFIVGLDGKMRYFKPIRAELYAFMREQLERWYPDPGLYLCMESDDVWRRSMGWSPGDSEGLCSYLDGRVETLFGRPQGNNRGSLTTHDTTGDDYVFTGTG